MNEAYERQKELSNSKSLSTKCSILCDKIPAEEKTLLDSGDGYYIHRNGQLLGIGRASGDTIDLVIAEQSGAGKDVVLALASLLTADTVRLTVASANLRAVRLYERLGFIPTKELSRWYRIV